MKAQFEAEYIELVISVLIAIVVITGIISGLKNLTFRIHNADVVSFTLMMSQRLISTGDCFAYEYSSINFDESDPSVPFVRYYSVVSPGIIEMKKVTTQAQLNGIPCMIIPQPLGDPNFGIKAFYHGLATIGATLAYVVGIIGAAALTIVTFGASTPLLIGVITIGGIALLQTGAVYEMAAMFFANMIWGGPSEEFIITIGRLKFTDIETKRSFFIETSVQEISRSYTVFIPVVLKYEDGTEHFGTTEVTFAFLPKGEFLG
ncbi:MAG: hypothetical protein QXY28_00820 [Candidatus Nanoarchaeia archaeon]|nr:hypothetical protein [Candidatus Jingweiarchaeum tengchongense]